jgi:hypothetical protein
VQGTPDVRWARSFVITFLAVLVICAVVPLSGWPFSAWELFSHPRSDRETGCLVVDVGSSGRGQVVAKHYLAHGHEHFDAFVAGLAAGSATTRNAVCAEWLRAVGDGARLLDVFHLSWLLSDRNGDRAAPPRRTLAWSCRAKEADAAD